MGHGFWSDYLPKKSLVGGGGGGCQTKFNVSPGPGLSPGTLDLLDLTWDLDLDRSLTKEQV